MEPPLRYEAVPGILLARGDGSLRGKGREGTKIPLSAG
jgi:hypothetical protein